MLLLRLILIVSSASVICGGVAAAVIEVNATDGIAGALAKAHAGDCVQLAAGTYPIDSTVRVSSGVKFAGEGADKTVLTPGANLAGPLIRLDGVEKVEIIGMTLDGGSRPQVPTAVYARDSRQLNLHDLRIAHLAKGAGFGPTGIHFEGDNPSGQHGVIDSAIVGCTFEDVGVGAEYGGAIRLSWGSSRNRIERNQITRTGRGGIFLNDGCTDVEIRGNTVCESGGEGLGIEAWKGCDRTVIEDNRVDHWISLDTSNFCAVRRNVVASSSGPVKANGLELVGSNYAIFTDNVVDGGQHLGISVSGDEPKECVLWAYNKIRRCQTWGAQLQGDKGGIARQYFYRCVFADTLGARSGTPLYPDDAGHGLRTNGNVRGVTFEACEFTGNAGAAVQLGGDHLLGLRFIGCTVRLNAGPRVDGHTEAAVWKDAAAAAPAGELIPRTAKAGEAADFAAPAGAKFLWDFGDGPAVSTQRAKHAYSRAGRYRVTLVIWDSGGGASRIERNVEVLPSAAAGSDAAHAP